MSRQQTSPVSQQQTSDQDGVIVSLQLLGSLGPCVFKRTCLAFHSLLGFSAQSIRARLSGGPHQFGPTVSDCAKAHGQPKANTLPEGPRDQSLEGPGHSYLRMLTQRLRCLGLAWAPGVNLKFEPEPVCSNGDSDEEQVARIEQATIACRTK